MVDKARGQNEGTADGKVGKIADEGSRRALQEQLDQHLEQLRRDARDRAEVEGADQDRQLAEVDLIERRGEGQRDLDEHQHARHRGEDRRIGDIMRTGEGLDVAAELFLQKGRDEHDGREDRETGEDECQVFHGFASFFFFGAKKNARRAVSSSKQKQGRLCANATQKPLLPSGLYRRYRDSTGSCPFRKGLADCDRRPGIDAGLL